MNFEEMIISTVMQSVKRQISTADFVKIDYQDRVKLPAYFLEKAFSLVDQESLLKKLAERLENELVNKLVNSIAQEMATDIKQVLSVKERREAVRSVVRDNIDTLTKL